MRKLFIIIFYCLFVININAQNIAIFKFSFILENYKNYIDFSIELNDFKKKEFEKLQNEEMILVSELQEIEDSKILLSNEKYLSKISEFNQKKTIFENKVNKLNNYLKTNLEKNENIVMNQIITITKKIATENNIDIIFSDDQYFLASDASDLSQEILKNLINSNISLSLSKYE